MPDPQRLGLVNYWVKGGYVRLLTSTTVSSMPYWGVMVEKFIFFESSRVFCQEVFADSHSWWFPAGMNRLLDGVDGVVDGEVALRGAR